MSYFFRPDVNKIVREIRCGKRGEAIGEEVSRALGAVLEGSYEKDMVKHPLGFFCLPIHRSGDLDGFGLCLHVWMAGAHIRPPTISKIHYHTWNLLSYVLFGGVRNQRIEITPNDARPTHRVFEIFSRGDADDICPTGQLVEFRVAGATTFGVGERYVVDPRDYHRTQVDFELAASVMLAENFQPGPQRGLGEMNTGRHVVHRERCTVDEAKAVAGKLLDHISSS